MSARVLTVVQARTGSTRLPGKVLRPVLGRPVLSLMLERVARADLSGSIVVATTEDPEDDAIVQLAQDDGFAVFRGSTDDVLDRHYQAARKHDVDWVVKIPSDCPLIDPAVIDTVLAEAASGSADFVSNLHPPSWPDGNDVEAMSIEALEVAWREASTTAEREHTTPFLWDNPDRFEVVNVSWDRDLSMSHRWVLDYPEDLEFIAEVFEALYPSDPAFGVEAVLRLLEDRPGLADRNAHLAGVNWYRHHLDELSTVRADETRLAPGEDA